MKYGNLSFENIKLQMDNRLSMGFGTPFVNLDKIKGAVTFPAITGKKADVKNEFNAKIAQIMNFENMYRIDDLTDVYDLKFNGEPMVSTRGGFTGPQLSLWVSNSKPNTFKFFDMDVTEDLTVVVKGSHGCVLVGNIQSEAMVKLLAYSSGYAQMDLQRIFSIENLKYYIEQMKFGKFDKENTLEPFQPMVEDSKGKGLTFGSVIMNFIKEKFVNSAVDVKASKTLDASIDIPYTMATALRTLYMKYRILKCVLSVYELWFGMYSTAYGAKEAKKKYTECMISGDADVFTFFGGVCKDGNIYAGSEKDFIVASYHEAVKSEALHGEKGKFYFEGWDLMITMSEFGSEIDYTELTDKDYMANSIIDYMKYNDTDLLFVEGMKADDKEIIVKNAIKIIRQQIRPFFGAISSKGLEDTISKLVLDKAHGIDVLDKSIKGNNKNRGNYILHKDSIMKSSALVEKIMKRSVAIFK